MAAKSSSVLRRALLYVPASSPRMLTKSLSLTTDNLTYDLEDSVTPSSKPSARTALQTHISSLSSRPASISELAVRLNAISTPYALDDLTSLAPLPQLDAIVIPKVNSASDLTFATDALRHLAPSRHSATGNKDGSKGGNPIKIIALIESAKAVMDLRSICAASPYLTGLIFAAEDFALDLSLTRTPSLHEFLYARSAIATAARAAGLPSTIDLVCTSYKGEEGMRRLEEECLGGKAMGFNGKQCIHPSQVDTVQRLFAPAEQEVEWAMRIVVADEKATDAGRGAWTLDGAMIDAPVVGKANAIVTKAERCGFDVKALRDKWKDQEPE
ncbi:Pyruvate/Phosphoenolpyruvate kinase-like domain-containing protein [Pseudomassariella vexata]|uniref:Pyruvate/Phosphoenolpyruvate kinase-like domain-containing protein n=1 Tax=Pseudomassariella vexata TaxID=1141098 RepID=A0A1Y2E393_9PEZI|nr:Pyruvate/Phosphoenolpyruvate kinase-like domain-containing protein [Pseudomassariella vexata]ORY66013.1 Pyruvate/Phosphoenolpyruvate kinase-like domain-containing protein [Pseudomassariella vexata]